MDTIHVAIVGTGGIAASHIRGLKELGERVRISAAVDVDRGRLDAFCAQHGIPNRYADLDQMLAAERPRLVHICTPPSLHCEQSVKALRAGAWVLCEKPLCGSLAEFDQIAAAERESGNFCSSVFQWRFGSGGQHFKRLIESGELGRPMLGVCNTTWYRNRAYYQVPWRGKWATELGGPTMGHGIHAMDLLLYQFGDWSEVTAMMGTLYHEIELEDVSLAMVKFNNGALGSIVNSVVSPREETLYRFDFENATVELKEVYSYTNANWSFTALGGDAREAQWRAIPGDDAATHGSQLRHLLDSMSRNERPLVSGHEARRTIEFLSAMYKSAATRLPVAAGSIQPGDPFYGAVAGSPPPRFGR
jgi:predicted dehydrogenase